MQFTNLADYKNISIAKSLTTHGFNDEQARLHGAIAPEFNQAEAMEYLNAAYSHGIRSIDMESSAFSAFCNYLSIPAAIIGVSIVNRLVSEDIYLTIDKQLQYLSSVADVLIRYIQLNSDIKNN